MKNFGKNFKSGQNFYTRIYFNRNIIKGCIIKFKIKHLEL